MKKIKKQAVLSFLNDLTQIVRKITFLVRSLNILLNYLSDISGF